MIAGCSPASFTCSSATADGRIAPLNTGHQRWRAPLKWDHFLVEFDVKEANDIQRSRFNEEQIIAILKE